LRNEPNLPEPQTNETTSPSCETNPIPPGDPAPAPAPTFQAPAPVVAPAAERPMRVLRPVCFRPPAPDPAPGPRPCRCYETSLHEPGLEKVL
jgi:hypothetical protein